MSQSTNLEDSAQPSLKGPPRWVGAAVFVVFMAGNISRRPDLWFAPQFWSEDGSVFFSDAEISGWAALLKPYAGYLLVVPRMIANALRSLPWEFLPAGYVLMATVVASLVGVRVAFARLPLLERMLAAAALVVVPHNGEVFLNITNLHWILDALLVVNLLEAAPENVSESWRRCFELLLVGLSTPITIILCPLAVIWSWRWRHSRFAWPLMSVWLIAVLIQGYSIGFSKRPMVGDTLQIAESLSWAAPQFSAAIFFGDWLPYSKELGRLAMGGGLLAMGVLFIDRTNDRRVWGLFLLLAAAGALLAGRCVSPGWPHPFGWGRAMSTCPLF